MIWTEGMRWRQLGKPDPGLSYRVGRISKLQFYRHRFHPINLLQMFHLLFLLHKAELYEVLWEGSRRTWVHG